MSETDINIHVLDAAYKPFPSFSDWLARTAVDTQRWERYNSSLQNIAVNASDDVLARARNVAKRAAAVDTGAIEGLYEVDRGFTFTVALEAATWELAIEQKGPNVRRLFDAQLNAYDYILDLATKAAPISEAAIRVLHEQVCAGQDTYRVITAVGPQEQALPKGQYKALPNHVRTRKGTNHSYAPVDATPSEMARLTGELRSDAFLKAHPVVQAAYAHYSLVVIHPFADGNGRVARALASAFTYRAVRIPIVILTEHKIPYLDALEAADGGLYEEFVRFMLARALETIALVTDSLRSALTPSSEQSLAAIQYLYLTRGGYSHDQVDEAAERLVQALYTAVTLVMAKFHKPPIETAAQNLAGEQYDVSTGYRLPLKKGRVLTFSLTTAAPASASVKRSYRLLVPENAAGDDDIQLVSGSPPHIFSAQVSELIPGMSGVLQLRINMAAEAMINEMLAELRKKAEAAMGRRS